MSVELEKILQSAIKSIEEYNSISENVNGRDAIIIPPYERSRDDDKYEDFEMYNIRKYLISCDGYVQNSKKGTYKSMVSESMKRKFIDITEDTKIIIKDYIKSINDFIYNKESLEVDKFIKNKEDIQKFNEILVKSHPDSMVSTYIANYIMNDENNTYGDKEILTFIMNSNIKLKLLNKKILCNNINKNTEITIKKIKYNLYTDFRFQNICDSTYISLKEKNAVEFLSSFLNININIDIYKNIRDENFLNECMNAYKDIYNKKLYIAIGDHTSINNNINNSNNFNDIVYSIKNITSSDVISPESGINRNYIEKTTTISKDLEENYLSPISLINNTFIIYNWIDIYDASVNDLNGDVLCLVFRKNIYGDEILQICSTFALYKNLQLFQPDLNNTDAVIVNNINTNSINNISEMIPSLYNNKKDMSDLGIFESVKIGHIRHRMIEMLKSYKRNQNKIENTDYLISVLFDSIYNEIWHKTPKNSNFSDEFFITFYSTVSRMVFKVRKDIMDRYSIMKDYESAKLVMIDILEKLEKNISKADSNIYNIYKITR